MFSATKTQKCSLPQELIDDILSKHTLDKEDLKSCSLVGREWRHTSQRLLFHNLYVSQRQLSLQILPDRLCDYVRHLTLDFPYMPPSTLASCANVIAQLLRITHLTVQRFNLLSIISESVVWDAFVVSLDIDGATPLKGLVLDGTNFTNTYSFHRMLSQSRLQYLEELFIRDCLIGNLPRGLDGYEEHTIRYPWPRYSTSLKTLTILRSPTVFNTLYDKRCPVDITGVRMLQYIMRQERDLELEKFRREFNSLTHLKSRGNKIAVEHFSKPALPLLTHYYIELSIRFPCLDIHHAAPNLRYVILDTQDIYPRPNNFQAFRDELLKIIIDAPLPNRVRFVVVVPRWALYQAREGLNLVNQNRPLEIYAPCTLRDPTMSHVDYDATLVEVS